MKTRLLCFLLIAVGWQSQLAAQGKSSKAPDSCEVADTNNYSTKFDFKADTIYRSNNNYLLAQLALLAYGTETEIEAQIRRWNKHRPAQDTLEHSVVEKCKDQFLIVSADSFIILSFRGTYNLKNIASDLDMKLIEFEEGAGLVHRGFYKTIKKLDNKIQEALESHQHQGAKQQLYLTGHSLGGALALLYPFVHEQQIQFTQITTFGQPKVGDQGLISYLMKQTQANGFAKDRYFRLVNASDLVAKLPTFDY
ncbi:MAG: lipase family protein, partial [Bacteroidota bacterium]